MSDKKALLKALIKKKVEKKTPSFEIEQLMGVGSEKHPIVRQPRTERLPLSFSQKRMWFFEQMYPGNCHYHVPLLWRLRGALQVEVLEKSFQSLVSRHESLRTCFTAGYEDEVVQHIVESSFTMSFIDVSVESNPERQAKQLIQTELERPFSLENGPLFRVQLMKIASDEYQLFVNMHHIISDGWSIGILMSELSYFYNTFLKEEPSSLPALPVQYVDFAVWQRCWLNTGVLEKQMTYWKRQLDGVSMLQLPTDYPRPATQTFAGKLKHFHLDKDMTDALKRLSHQTGTTLFMILLTAWNILLKQYSHQDDVAVGTPVAGRNQFEIENVVGFFVNTLVIRSNVTGSMSFLDLLQQVKETTSQAYENQDVPFEKLVSELDIVRDTSHSPLFQVLFALQNMPSEPLEFSGLDVQDMEQENGTALFDLSLVMVETADGLKGVLEYNTALFTETRIARMTEHFRVLLAGIVHDPTAAIESIPLISSHEREQLLTKWHMTLTPGHPDECIHTLFTKQVEKMLDKIAIKYEEQTITYKDLNARANALAQLLLQQGVQPNNNIGIYMKRSINQVISMLAILKVGSAYVCLDPSHPEHRLQYIIDETEMPVLLIDGDISTHFANVQMFCVDELSLSNGHLDDVVQMQSSTTIANIIYTSGSTGKPKGVRVTHEGIVRLATDETCLPFSTDEVYLYTSSVSFDAATFEIWRSLLSGAQVVIMPTERPSVQDYARVIQRYGISILLLMTGEFNDIVDDNADVLQGIKYLLVGGEALSTLHVKNAMQRLSNTQLINVYGPIENTVFTTFHPITQEDLVRSAIPIGRPITSTDVYVLDERQKPVPIGAVGELCTGGAGLAAGYLNQPILTEESFIPHPFQEGKNKRLYRTGDLVRYLPNGTLTFVGRRDYQVKIRGFRVELEEVEAILLKDARIRSAAVQVHEQEEQGKQLVAYVIPEGIDLDTGVLRADLKKQLPPFMIPKAIVVLQEMPLTTSGKVNRKALPAPDWEEYGDKEKDIVPITHTEQVLIQIWKHVLKVTHVNRYDDFFHRGGNAILAAQLVSHVQKLFAINIILEDLFQSSVLLEMAQEIKKYIDCQSHSS